MGRGNVGSLLEGIGAGYEVTGRVMRDSELARISQLKPTQTDGGFSFLGKNYDSMPDETTLGRDRQLAMAGVFDRFGEVQRGSEMRQSVRRDEIADQGLAMQRQRFEWEKQQVAAAQEEQKLVKAMNAELQEVFKNSAPGKRGQAYAEALAASKQKRAAYQEALAAGDNTAIAPPDPIPTPPTVGEALLLNAETLAVRAKYGKASPEDFLKLADMFKQAEEEGYIKALMLAQNGAPATQVVAAFNASGKMKLDPNSIVSDPMVDRGGIPSRLMTLKHADGSTQTIDSYAELTQFGKGKEVAELTFKANADRRGANADARGAAADARSAAASGREAARFNADAPERELKQTLAKLQTERLQPGTTPERRAEIDQMLVSAKGADQKPPSYKFESGDVTMALGDPAVDRNGKPVLDLMSGRQVVNRNVAREKQLYDFMGKNGITDTNEGLIKFLQSEGKPGGGASSAPATGTVPPKEKRVVGQTYQTPRGPMVWNGSGWVEPTAPSRKSSGVVQ